MCRAPVKEPAASSSSSSKRSWARRAGLVVATLPLVPVTILGLVRVLVVDNDVSQLTCPAGNGGVLCSTGGCPDAPMFETRGEFNLTAENVRRSLKVIFRQNGVPILAHAERRFRHFLENPDLYSLTNTDFFPALRGVDLDDADDWSLGKWFFSSFRDRVSLLVALVRFGEKDPPPPMPDFVHSEFMGILDRVPSALDATALLYQQQRSTGMRYFRASPVCDVEGKRDELRRLAQKAVESRSNCLDYEAEAVMTAINAVNTGDSLLAVDAIRPVCFESCLRPQRNCSDVTTSEDDTKVERFVRRVMMLAEFRRGEVDNCIARHTGESCILPLVGTAQHVDPTGASNALDWLHKELEVYPEDQAAKFFKEVAQMQLGQASSLEFPKAHPTVSKFPNLAKPLGLDYFGITGANNADDWVGDDGLLDVMQGAMVQWPDGPRTLTLMKNSYGAPGAAFADISLETNLSQATNVWNIKQTDIDNDGDLDLYIARGGWASSFSITNSLLRNDGGYFTEVTRAAGMLNYQGTHSAEWADFDLDGFMDLYVGNEQNPCRLFRNRGDGTFEDFTSIADVGKCGVAKGVMWCDVNTDGWPDILVSQFGGANKVFLNPRGKKESWAEKAQDMGLTMPRFSFPVGCADLNHDGLEDVIFAAHRTPDPGEVYARLKNEPWLEQDIVERRLGKNEGLTRIYLNKGDGTFVDSVQPAVWSWGTMGFNVGDIDNDGFFDLYFGTGMPDMRGLVPNVMWRNLGNGTFEDVTFQGGFGHLQKGHAITFADLQNDGHQDILANVGGAFVGDAVPDAAFVNPGVSPEHSWVKISLTGTKANRLGHGARLNVTVDDDGGSKKKNKKIRSFYVIQGMTGSFGSNPVKIQHVGLGNAKKILSVAVTWPHADLIAKPEVFTSDLPINSWITLVEGSATAVVKHLPTYDLDLAALQEQDQHMACSHHQHNHDDHAAPPGWI